MANTSLYIAKENLIKTILATNSTLRIDWKVFKDGFNTIYPNFFASILIKGVHLSTKEEHLLMLEKLHFNTSTIAKILDVLPESVYTSRYRLNKKINKTTHKNPF